MHLDMIIVCVSIGQGCNCTEIYIEIIVYEFQTGFHEIFTINLAAEIGLEGGGIYAGSIPAQQYTTSNAESAGAFEEL